MKIISLLSDTHGVVDKRFIPHLKKSDEIWHAGDIGSLDVYDILNEISVLRAVYGNIDNHKIRIVTKSDLIFRCEEMNVYITHIGGYPGKYKRDTEKKIKEIKPDIFICGHSHILKVINDKKNDLLHINPGAAGDYGIHQVKTMIKFTIDKDNIKDLKIIELKR